MKKMKKRLDRKGISLIELIGAVFIISIVLGISAYSIIGLVRHSKDKSYEVIIENIKSAANNYLNENNGKIHWIKDKNNTSNEFTCISVDALISYGFFDKKIKNNEDFLIPSYVQINRDTTSKSITNEDLSSHSDEKCAPYYVKAPECKNPTYNGETQNVIDTNNQKGYTISGSTTGIKAGNYDIIANLKSDYAWDDGTTDVKSLTCKIAKKKITLKLDDIILPDTYFDKNNKYIGDDIEKYIDYLKETNENIPKTDELEHIQLEKSADNTKIKISSATFKNTKGNFDSTSNYEINFKESNLTLVNTTLPAPTTAICRSGLIYNGELQALAKAPANTTLSSNAGVAAGKYKVIINPNTLIVIKEGKKYSWPGLDKYAWDDGKSGPYEIECSIAPKKLSVKPNTLTAFDIDFDNNNIYNGPEKAAQIDYINKNTSDLVEKDKITDVTISKETSSNKIKVSKVVIKEKNTGTDFSSSYELQSVENTLNKVDTKLPVPTTAICKNPVYNGQLQTLATAPANTTLSNNGATDAGTYTVNVTPNKILNRGENRYTWADGTTGVKKVTCSIKKANLTVTLSTLSRTYNGSNIRYSISDVSATGVNGARVNTPSQNVNFKYYNNSSCTSEVSNTIGNSNSDTIYYGKAAINNLNNYNNADSNCAKIEIITERIITFNNDNSCGTLSISSRKANSNGEYGTLPTLSRKDYTFDGWYTSKSGGNVITSNTKVGNSNTTIYSRCHANTYNINYDANGGSGAPSTQTYTYSDSGTINLSSTTPTRNGYTFIGWNTNKNATSTQYSAGGQFSKNIDNNTKLYAIWRVNKCTINYSAGDGRFGVSVSSQTVNYNDYINSTHGLLNPGGDSAKASRSNYHIDPDNQWKCTRGSCSTIDNPYYNQDKTNYKALDICKNLKNGDESVTLTVYWRRNVCTIKYNANGGKFGVTPSDTTVKFDASLSSNGLLNPGGNSAKASRNGYNINSSKQWVCLSDNCVQNTYDQDTSYAANKLCKNLSSGNQTIKLGVNWIDNIDPTCKTTKSDTGDTDGVNVTVKCSDAGSGCKKDQEKHSDVKKDKTYTVEDKAGNKGTCKVDVKSVKQTRHKTRSWNKCKTTKNTCKYGCDKCDGYKCDGSGSTNCMAKSSTNKPGNGMKCKSCKYNCKCSSCHTGSKKECVGGWNDWSGWSNWSTNSCKESDSKKCDSRTIYK